MREQRCILVIDDDLDVRESVVGALEDEGYRVLAAATGREGIDLLEAGARPDVILLDLMMPVMDGWTFRATQRQRPDIATIPVVVFSAHDGGVRRTAQQLEAACYLEKPLRLEDLIAAVSGAMAD